jgi:DNA-binding transcriptional ArsR family regulator
VPKEGFDLDEVAPWDTPPDPVLKFYDVSELVAEVDAAGRPEYLLQPVWAEGDYGVVGAVDKAGKSWMAADAAVSVASGTPWLGIFPVSSAGSVLLFAGEGGPRKVVRRLRAVCEARDLELTTLPIRVCLRVPHLTSEAAMLLVADEIAATRPVLVIIDPLYLAARGARSSDLNEMGGHLEAAQLIAQRYGSALMVVHHWNQTGSGKGAIRFSGAGPSAWGRVLISAAVVSRHTDPVTRRTTVVLDLDCQGDETADRTVRIRREVWSDDPDDLSSPLHYRVTELDEPAPSDPRTAGLAPAATRILRVLEDEQLPLTVQQIGDRVAVDDTGRGGLKERTIQDGLAALSEAGLVDGEASKGRKPGYWWFRTDEPQTEEAENGL